MGTVANNSGVSGISLQGVTNIKSAIQAYHTEIDKQAKYWLTLKNSAGSEKNAMRGDYSLKELDKYAEAIINDCTSYTNWLKTFEEKLNEIQKRYTSNDQNNNTFANATRKI